MSSKDADARRLLKLREGQIAEGKFPGLKLEKITFDELAEDFLTDYKINNKKSRDRAERSVRHLKKGFQGMKVMNINTPRIQNYIKGRLNGGVANATINRELAALKRMLNLGAKQTPPKVTQVPYVPMLKENNVRKGVFEYEDFVKLRDALPKYLRGLVTFAYKTGWRVSEITNLTWSKVDLKQGIVRLEAGETKNDEGRTIYLDEELKEVFSGQWKQQEKNEKLSPYVFPGIDGIGKISNYQRAWRSANQNSSIGKHLFHDFRRTAVRDMIRAWIPERVAMMVSGHKTRTIFDRYNIVNDTDLRLAASQREAYQQRQMGTVTGTIINLTDL